MNVKNIDLLTKKLFVKEEIVIDCSVIEVHCNKYNLNIEILEEYFLSILSNMSFFKTNLNYPLQVSNLLLYEIDARSNSSGPFRGSSLRNNLILEYRKILNSVK